MKSKPKSEPRRREVIPSGKYMWQPEDITITFPGQTHTSGSKPKPKTGKSPPRSA